MNTLSKAACAAVYLLALLSLVLPFPAGAGPVIQTIALTLLAVHALETVVMFKHVKSYNGPLATSIVLSLLFGLLHWMPLAKANRKAVNS